MQELFKRTRKFNLTGYWIFLFLFSITLFLSCNKKNQVEYREEQIVIPTYELGANEVNPQFYTPKDVQGTKGNVYPYAMQDQLTDKKTDITYKAVDS